MRMRSNIVVALAATLAIAAGGCGSEDPSAVAVDTVAPAAVLDVTAEVNDGGIRLDWTASSEVDLAGYHVYRSVNRNVPSLVGSTSTNSFTDVALGSGVSFRYEVAAYDDAGNVGPRASSLAVVVQPRTSPTRRADHD